MAYAAPHYRRERRMAARLSTEYTALTGITPDTTTTPVSPVDVYPESALVAPIGGDDDDADEVGDLDDFYADAFEVIE